MITINDVYKCLDDCYDVEVCVLNEYEDRTYYGVKEYSPNGYEESYILYSVDGDIYNDFGSIIYSI